MNATFARRMPDWRVFVWTGVIGSLVTWAWAWYLGRGPSVITLLVALAAVALAFRATQGYRWALVGLMVAGLAMFLAALYWMYLLQLATAGNVPMVEWLAGSVLPMVFAAVLLVGAIPGFRRASAAA